MVIKKFESFSKDLLYEEKTMINWVENKKKSVKIDLDEVLEVANYLITAVYITLYFRPGGEHTFRKSYVKQMEQDIRNGDDIYVFDVGYTNSFFKDDDEWWWFYNGDRVWKCDEMIGLKTLLDKLGYSKNSEYI